MLQVKTKRKYDRKGVVSYIKYSLFGCVIGMMSFPAVLATQSLSSEGVVEHTTITVTNEDLNILKEYMNQDDLYKIEMNENDVDEIIVQYEKIHPDFTEVLNDYYGLK